MNWIEIAWIGMSAASLTLAVIHLFVWFKQKSQYAHLLFFALALAVSATAFGGFNDIPLPGGLRLDGYGQAGVVGGDAFVDGAVRAARTIMTSGKARLSAGAGLWGGAQPGVRRVDIGPQIVATLPINARAVRISGEWRQRVAGNAAPISGPSITLGFDF